MTNIDIMNTMIGNFPDNLLDDLSSSRDSYDSIFKFIVDVLESMGIDVSKVYGQLLTALYGVEYDFELQVENLTSQKNNQNKRIEGLETAIKSMFMAFFGGIFSCSFHPFIANKFFDSTRWHNNNNDFLMSDNLRDAFDVRYFDHELVVPKKMIDIFNILDVCPTTQKGLYYYDINGEYKYYKKVYEVVYINGVETYQYKYLGEDELKKDQFITLREKKTAKIVSERPEYASKLTEDVVAVYEGTTAIDLYKTTDMNAFIWYVLNIGNAIKGKYIPYNKMMWDNRNVLLRDNVITYDTFNNNLNSWYEAKSATTTNLSLRTELKPGVPPDYPDGYFSGSTLYSKGMRPILQLEPAKRLVSDDLYTKNLVFHIPSEEYFAPGKKKLLLTGSDGHSFNATMWAFNKNYLDSIQIFNPKFLAVRTIENLSELLMGAVHDTDISLNGRLIRNKLHALLKTMCSKESTIVEDCFFEFSNDELDEILKNTELERHGLYKNVNGEVVKRNIEEVDKLKDNLYNSVQKGSISVITNENSVGDRNIEIDDGISFDIDPTVTGGLEDLTLEDLITAFTMPFIESLFTPQIMLFIMINMKTLGLIDEDKIDELIGDTSKLYKFILSKMMVIVNSLVEFIKDFILQILLNLVLTKLTEWLKKYKWLQAIETTAYWLDLLNSSLKCLRTFKFKLPSVLNTRPDEVNYADIKQDNELDRPEASLDCPTSN